MKQVVEGGHFYLTEGFNPKCKEGWKITESLCRENGNESMLFIDDVHEESMHASNEILPIHITATELRSSISDKTEKLIDQINQNDFVSQDSEVITLSPNHILLESEMLEYTLDVIEILKDLPRRKRIRFRDGKWAFCSNVKVLHPDGTPTCVWFDLWLTLLKQKQWFEAALNVLPATYYPQQAAVSRIYQKVDPNFPIQQHYI